MEVTDDKDLPKAERKLLQIEHAAHSSHEAKLVKLADKISNLRDLLNTPPKDWPKERLAEYFEWADKVVSGVRGVNPELEKIFDKLIIEGRKRYS
jgi:guanosine-3',5'-bis(diphosphate) 3'-pyrophosphohydrolase